MAESRTKPSRIIKQAAFLPANLPASGNSVTVALEGVPTRGVIHRITANFVSSVTFPAIAASIDGFFVHRLGAAGTNNLSDTHMTSIVVACAIDFQTSGLAGSATAYTTNRFLRSVLLSPASTGVGAYQTAAPAHPNFGSYGTMQVAYDINGQNAGAAPNNKILGPNANDNTLYLTILSGGTNFKDPGGAGTNVQSCWVELEIEPCF